MLQRLYSRLPNLLQCLLISLFNVSAYAKRYGGEYKHYLNLFVRNRNLTYEELKTLQEAKLKSFISYSMKNSKYYNYVTNYSFHAKILYIYNREDSFSFKKFKGSMDSSISSHYKLPFKKINKINYYIRCKFKVIIVYIILKLGLINIYFNKIGKTPSKEEINEFSIHRLSLK